MNKSSGNRAPSVSKRETVNIPGVRSLYYHRDFDGTVSAAMLIALSARPLQLHPVDYYLKPTWATLRLKKPAAIVDFLFHPDAVLWIDHHADPFVLPHWRELASNGQSYVWDSVAPSCPPLIIKTFSFRTALKDHFAPYIRWSSIIDSALYETPQAATDLSNPFLLLSEILALPSEISVANRIANEIAHHDIQTVLSHADVRPFANGVLETEERLRHQLLSHLQYDGLVALLDQSFAHCRFRRYYPYLVYPDAAYVVGIYWKDDVLTVSIGTNPWKPEPEINLGLLCRVFGGGGRKNVGGVPAKSISDANIIARKIISKLHHLAPVPSSYHLAV